MAAKPASATRNPKPTPSSHPKGTINRLGEATDLLGPIEMAGKGRFLPLWVVKILKCGKMKRKTGEFDAAHFEYFLLHVSCGTDSTGSSFCHVSTLLPPRFGSKYGFAKKNKTRLTMGRHHYGGFAGLGIQFHR